MHGNSSARPEAIPQLSLALSLGATLVAFDFAGSGRSGGDHVSLGYYERDDLKVKLRAREPLLRWTRVLVCGSSKRLARLAGESNGTTSLG